MQHKDMKKITPDSTVRIITDEPASEDVLDFDRYSKQLANIIMNSTPHFTIGVFGGWGTGKTTLMKMIEKKLKDANYNDILVVWFDAWKYENEKYLAVVPFLRTIKMALENKMALEYSNIDSKTQMWHHFTKALEKTFTAFVDSTNISFGLGNQGSTQINLEKFTNTLKADGSAIIDGEKVFYHEHITDHLKESLIKLREKNCKLRVVVFIDDLDRCHPKQALEVLDSIKTFFDIEGIVYVIGMDSNSINSIIKEKYGEDSDVKKGLDYLQKIVQLPFQIPTWKQADISSSIDKIISRGLEGSKLSEDFKKNENKDLISKAVPSNPRELKRFINNIILAKSVFDKPIDDKHIDQLIVVQALNFRQDWKNFLELITPNDRRKRFFEKYKSARFTQPEELDNFSKELSDPNNSSFKYMVEIYAEILKQGDPLREFLEGAAEILLQIEYMEEYRRALDTTELKPDFPERKELESHARFAQSIQYWLPRFNEDKILSLMELYSFDEQFFESMYSWFKNIRDKQSSRYYAPINELIPGLHDQITKLRKARPNPDIPLDEKEEKSILNMQKEIAETLERIDRINPP